MTEDLTTIEPEPALMGLTVPQEKAAECLADGGRFWQAAEMANVDIRTITRWVHDETFIDYCVQLRQAARATRRAKRERLIRAALDVEYAVLTGAKVDERIAARAASILAQTEYRVWTEDSPDSWISGIEQQRGINRT